MNKEMIISSTPHETRVAILEDDQVVEIFIEREHSRGVVGNVYKGRVSKVLPGMQSAFVDLGLERDAFLYVTDVISPTEEALEDIRLIRHREALPCLQDTWRRKSHCLGGWPPASLELRPTRRPQHYRPQRHAIHVRARPIPGSRRFQT